MGSGGGKCSGKATGKFVGCDLSFHTSHTRTPEAGNAAVKLLEESPRKAAFIKKHTKRIDLAFARKGSRELIHTYIHTYIHISSLRKKWISELVKN